MGPEDRIQSELIKFRDRHKERHPRIGWLFAIPNGSYKNVAQRMLFQRTGLTPGVWDLFLPYPKRRWKDGKKVLVPGLWMETKQPGGKLRKEQKNFLKEVIIPGNFDYKVFTDWRVGAWRVCMYLSVWDREIERELNGGGRS